jgi:hypothetical protein
MAALGTNFILKNFMHEYRGNYFVMYILSIICMHLREELNPLFTIHFKFFL